MIYKIFQGEVYHTQFTVTRWFEKQSY